MSDVKGAIAEEKTPEQIRLEDIKELRDENEKVITLALKRRGQLDNLLNGFVTDGQGNKYPVDQAAAEEMVSETSSILKVARAKVDALQTKIAFKQKEEVATPPEA